MHAYVRALTLTITSILFSTTLALPVSAVTVDSGVTFGPYVQRIKKTAASILIHTDLDVPVTLKYRKEGKSTWKEVTDTAHNQHAFRIKSLKENTTYEYYFENTDEDRITTTYTFTTKRDITEDAPLRVAVFGDSGGFTTDQFRVAMQMQWWQPDLLLHTGDIAYDAGTTDQWLQTFFKPYQPLIAQVPFYASIGNHDYVTEQAGPYKELFETPTRYSDTEDYYAFDFDTVHFVSLNTNIDYSEGSEQYTWLVNDLEESTKPWKIVYFHHPVYSSGEHGSTSGMADILSPVFEEHGVQLVLNGHDHDYERNQEINGVRYIVTGGGGFSLYEEETENPQSELFVSEYHFLGLVITDDTLKLKAIDKRGYVFDELEMIQ